MMFHKKHDVEIFPTEKDQVLILICYQCGADYRLYPGNRVFKYDENNNLILVEDIKGESCSFRKKEGAYQKTYDRLFGIEYEKNVSKLNDLYYETTT